MDRMSYRTKGELRGGVRAKKIVTAESTIARADWNPAHTRIPAGPVGVFIPRLDPAYYEDHPPIALCDVIGLLRWLNLIYLPGGVGGAGGFGGDSISACSSR
jgi:hypothetical protein